jgi:alkyl-hydroperoxide reductase/thiol specific antioxidant family protein
VKVLGAKPELDRCGATALFVAHDSADVLRRTLLARLEVPYPVLVDVDRSAYSGWGLERGSVAAVWGDPRAWLRSAAAVLGGARPVRPGRDTLQLGGDFVVDAAGRVVYARPQRRDDRPPVSTLVHMVTLAQRAD